jgi:hypothetical protein
MSFLSQNTVHMILWVEMVCLNFSLAAVMCASTPWAAALIQALCAYPCLVPCDYVAQEVIALLTVLCQKGQCTGLPFHFVLFCKHRWHSAWIQFTKTKFVRLSWISDRVICGKCKESDEMVNCLFSWISFSTAHTKSSLATDGWLLCYHHAHFFTSFIIACHSSSFHWITHGMFSIHLTKLTNVSRFHVSCI